MQVVDQDRLKDVCSIGMEFLEDNLNFSEPEEIMEYKANTVDQANFKSLYQFPGVITFIKDCLDYDTEDLPAATWAHTIHRDSSGLTKKFTRVIAYLLLAFYL